MAVNFLVVSKCCADLLTILINQIQLETPNSQDFYFFVLVLSSLKENWAYIFRNSYPQKFGITITKDKNKLKVLFKKNHVPKNMTTQWYFELFILRLDTPCRAK